MFFFSGEKFKKGTLYEKIRKSIMFFSVFPVVIIILVLIPVLLVQKKTEIERVANTYLSNSFSDLADDMSDLENVAQSIVADNALFTEIGRIVTDENVTEYERIQFKSQKMSVLKTVMTINNIQEARFYIEILKRAC